MINTKIKIFLFLPLKILTLKKNHPVVELKNQLMLKTLISIHVLKQVKQMEKDGIVKLPFPVMLSLLVHKLMNGLFSKEVSELILIFLLKMLLYYPNLISTKEKEKLTWSQNGR
jgi:hypothetical protein